MDKILDMFLGTPLARRYLAGFAERGVIWLLGALAGLAGISLAGIDKDIASFAKEVAPYVATAVLFVIAQKRMKKAEVTIETSRVLPGETPRALIDATVKTLLNRRQAPTQEAATSVAIDHVIAGPEGESRQAATDALNGVTPPSDMLQKVPPGTVDRTD